MWVALFLRCEVREAFNALGIYIHTIEIAQQYRRGPRNYGFKTVFAGGKVTY